MRCVVLLSVLVLSACANFPLAVEDGAGRESRPAEAAARPAPPPQKPAHVAPVEQQQPAPATQSNLPQKPKHNVEED